MPGSKRTGLSALSRSVGGRTAKDYSILVVYDGERTEDDYFRGWKLIVPPSRLLLETKFVRSGGSVLKAVLATIKTKKSTRNFAECWCVCDVDDSEDDEVAEAQTLADREGIRLCLSRRCFEVWYVLHYEFSERELLSERQAVESVARFIPDYGNPYKTAQFHELFALTDNAIENSAKLASRNIRNPATSVHNLVRKLKQNLPNK